MTILDKLIELKDRFLKGHADPQDISSIDGWVEEAKRLLILDNLKGHSGIKYVLEIFSSEVQKINQQLTNSYSKELPDSERDRILDRRELAQKYLNLFTGIDEDLTITPNGTGEVIFGKVAYFPSGSAAAPAMAFSGDTDTGAYSDVANNFKISTAGVVRVIVASSTLFSSSIPFVATTIHTTTLQSATCAAGVLSLTPTADTISIDANGAACAVTLVEPAAGFLGNVIKMYIATSAGAGAVTFPDVADIHDGPTLCTTTGIVLNGTYSVLYADMANDKLVGYSCQTN